MLVETDFAVSVSSFPDPVWSANLYCAGRLDQVIRNVVAPLRRELRRRTGDSTGFIWMMRYNRGGEHLKLRLHGSRGAMARDLLSGLAERYFAGLGEPDAGAARATPTPPPPPVDPEDEAENGHPDRSLLWTRYRRSHVSLAGKPLLLDDTYASLATRCLGRGCDLVLRALENELSPTLRQLSLLQALIGGLAVLGLPTSSRAAYFAFHRDSLVRFWLARRGGAGAEKAVALTTQFDHRKAAMAAALAPLREMAQKEWGGASGLTDPEDAAWRSSLADLFRYVSRFREDPAYPLDPFAEDPAFLPLFKALHGFANQLGLNPIEEAFTHHLLLDMAQPPGTAAAQIRLLDFAAENRGAPVVLRSGTAARTDPGPVGTPARSIRHDEYQWPHFVARSGPEGKEWMAAYWTTDRLQLTSTMEEALQLLRRQQIQEGKDLLDQVASRLDQFDEAPASVALVIKRFFWAVLAYYHYCVEDFELAEQTVAEAEQAIVSAIELAPFLLPLAIHCHEFRLQRARVARNRRRWPEVRARLQEVSAMLEDRLPLCVLSDGQPIYVSSLVEFHLAIPSLDPEELDSLRFYFNPEHRREQTERFFRSLYVQPGFVISYP